MPSNVVVGIIDVHGVTRDTYAALLHIELGLTAVATASAAELLEKLQITTPDLLIVGDGRPATKGGLGAIETLNARFPGVPLIAIGRHYPSLGADEVLDEPVDAEDLVSLARSLLLRAHV